MCARLLPAPPQRRAGKVVYEHGASTLALAEAAAGEAALSKAAAHIQEAVLNRCCDVT